VKSKISYATNTWMTPQMMFSFAGTLASWIDDGWKMMEVVVDFADLAPKEHKGKEATLAFARSIAK
jgi:hypothetical protein